MKKQLIDKNGVKTEVPLSQDELQQAEIDRERKRQTREKIAAKRNQKAQGRENIKSAKTFEELQQALKDYLGIE